MSYTAGGGREVPLQKDCKTWAMFELPCTDDSFWVGGTMNATGWHLTFEICKYYCHSVITKQVPSELVYR